MVTKQLNVRLEPEDLKKLQSLAAACEVTPSGLAGYFMRAAIRAAERQGFVRLPLEFDIKEPVIPSRPERQNFNESQVPLKHRA